MYKIDDDAEKRLLDAAWEAREKAYAPYSGFKVGAAVLTPSGQIFRGCNVENASYGLTVCAERNAVFQAVSAGETKILAAAIVTEAPVPAPPCGACRQVLTEFGPEAAIILENRKGAKKILTMSELLPHRFELE